MIIINAQPYNNVASKQWQMTGAHIRTTCLIQGTFHPSDKNILLINGDLSINFKVESFLYCKKILNGPILASFSFIFGLFKLTIQFLQQINIKNVKSIQYTAPGFEPMTSGT